MQIYMKSAGDDEALLGVVGDAKAQVDAYRSGLAWGHYEVTENVLNVDLKEI